MLITVGVPVAVLRSQKSLSSAANTTDTSVSCPIVEVTHLGIICASELVIGKNDSNSVTLLSKDVSWVCIVVIVAIILHTLPPTNSAYWLNGSDVTILP